MGVTAKVLQRLGWLVRLVLLALFGVFLVWNHIATNEPDVTRSVVGGMFVIGTASFVPLASLTSTREVLPRKVAIFMRLALLLESMFFSCLVAVFARWVAVASYMLMQTVSLLVICSLLVVSGWISTIFGISASSTPQVQFKVPRGVATVAGIILYAFGGLFGMFSAVWVGGQTSSIDAVEDMLAVFSQLFGYSALVVTVPGFVSVKSRGTSGSVQKSDMIAVTVALIIQFLAAVVSFFYIIIATQWRELSISLTFPAGLVVVADVMFCVGAGLFFSIAWAQFKIFKESIANVETNSSFQDALTSGPYESIQPPTYQQAQSTMVYNEK